MSRHQQKIIERYYEHKETIQANRLAEIVSDLYLSPAGTGATRLWERAAKAMQVAKVDEARIKAIVNKRDLDALARMAGELSVGATSKKNEAAAAAAAAPAPATPPAAATASASASTNANDPTSPQTLKMALKAFKKRLKLQRLDEESRLGRSPLSGAKAHVTAIQPPRDYPQAVWDELVKQGKLKTAGRGFYELG